MTASFLSDLIQELHQRIPKVSIGADVIVGFPGETEEKFQRTYSLIESLPFSYLHVFPFSKRKGTPAYQFSRVVNEGKIKERAEVMRSLGTTETPGFLSPVSPSGVDGIGGGSKRKRDRKVERFFSKLHSCPSHARRRFRTSRLDQSGMDGEGDRCHRKWSNRPGSGEIEWMKRGWLP